MTSTVLGALRRIAHQFVLVAFLVALPVAGRAETRAPEPTVVSLRLNPPITVHFEAGRAYFSTLAGFSVSGILPSSFEADVGGGWGGWGPNGGTGIELHGFFGASHVLLDRRIETRARWTVRCPTLVGYRFATRFGQTDWHVLSSNLGLAVTYWFSSRVGFETRALADLGLVLASTSEHSALDAPALAYGWTASLGFSVVSESSPRLARD